VIVRSILVLIVWRVKIGNIEYLFVEMLESDPTEASLGLNPPPAHMIYKAWRPFYRPAAAWSLGELRSKRASLSGVRSR